MKHITLKKISKEHLLSLQKSLEDYSEGFKEYLQNSNETNDYMYSVSQVSIASGLWFAIRSKIEAYSTPGSMKLKGCEAVVMFNACGNAQVLSTDHYEILVANEYRAILHKELKSFFSPEQIAGNTLQLTI